jgi:prepilin-type N-terminal cleavage/methylation domain-containing protein
VVVQDGFSLVEVVIATSLMAVIALGLGQAMVQGIQHGETIKQDREVRAVCQSMAMELANRPWGTSTQVGSVEYMRVNSPLTVQFSGFPNETGQVAVTDITSAYPEKEKTGSVYRISVSFRQHSYTTYVENVN